MKEKIVHKVRGKPNCAPKLGETFIVMNDDSPRRNWKLARVVELPPGEPVEIRTAKVRMANGNIFRRALSHLIPLEIGGTRENPTTERPPDSEKTAPEREPGGETEGKTETKLERKAKIEAKQKIEKILRRR